MKKGFTLAETLITLAIIGIVAALTIPALVQNYQEKETITRVKRVYSMFSQAYNYTILENGSPETWGISTPNNAEGNINLFNKFKPYLKIHKMCSPEDNTCFKVHDSYFRQNNVYTFILNDGSKVYLFGRSEKCDYTAGTTKELQNICGDITLELDYLKNKVEYSYVRYWITKYGIIPKGTQAENNNPEGTIQGLSKCLKDKGETCTAWILQNENFEYLKCDDLNWGTKTKCSD